MDGRSPLAVQSTDWLVVTVVLIQRTNRESGLQQLPERLFCCSFSTMDELRLNMDTIVYI